jgi:hypothetical protein
MLELKHFLALHSPLQAFNITKLAIRMHMLLCNKKTGKESGLIDDIDRVLIIIARNERTLYEQNTNWRYWAWGDLSGSAFAWFSEG